MEKHLYLEKGGNDKMINKMIIQRNHHLFFKNTELSVLYLYFV